ncbi:MULTISPECIES: polysaccharide deacetylase family protein [Enterococcus]|uniref:NodB homology domain-containing protein n=1 Tax=Enterococcus sulfureus ATCC 49903 TaxID=1140003 RepID=S0PC18_9ENTE|nr:polysaccharide deacetylase family protein [Enterococcus sulfureus]EOT46677.1 hypothetical protein OMY_01826 [Enterococcus sulfureus ATCC 49903]EOT86011.1 hypothetical protein I573_00764 [Enterococcus sulfureus ATCC 49903]
MSNSTEPVQPESKKGWLYSKWTIAVLLILLLGVITPISLYFVHKVQAETLEKEQLHATQELVKQLEKSTFSNQQFEQEKKGNLILFTDNTLSDSVKKLSTSFIEKETSDTDLTLASTHIQTVTDQVGEVKTLVTNYIWDTDKKDFTKKSEKSLEPTYVDLTTQQSITPQELIVDDAHLAAIHLAVQQKLLDEAKEPSAILDQVLALPDFTWDTKMIYTPTQLTITLPENSEIEQKQVTLDYPEIARAVNPAYIDPSIVATFSKNEHAGKKQIALTFDDGPNPATTPSILETLKQKNVHATFFQLGEQVEMYPDLAKQVHEQGHLIGSHTYHHLNLVTQTEETIKEEIQNTDKAIFKASGILPTIVRPPYGAVNQTVAECSGRPIIQWDIDSLDWKTKNSAKTLQQIQSSVVDNGIILMHDIQPSTAAVLPQLIDWLQAQGYELVTVDQLLDYDALPLHQYFSQDDERVIS